MIWRIGKIIGSMDGIQLNGKNAWYMYYMDWLFGRSIDDSDNKTFRKKEDCGWITDFLNKINNKNDTHVKRIIIGHIPNLRIRDHCDGQLIFIDIATFLTDKAQVYQIWQSERPESLARVPCCPKCPDPVECVVQ